MFSNGISELDTLVIRSPVDPLVIEEVRKVLVQEANQPFHVIYTSWFWRALLNNAHPNCPSQFWLPFS